MEGKILLGLKDWSNASDLYRKGLSWIEMILVALTMEGQFRQSLANFRFEENSGLSP